MSPSIPSHTRALVRESKGKAVVKSIPTPELEENEVLIETAYITQNPTDWKHVDYIGEDNAISGCDFSGRVVKLGSGLKNSDVKVGDEVAGVVHGGKFPNKGSFSEYLKAESDLIWKVPSGGKVSLKEAPQYGVGFTTAAQILYQRQSVPYPSKKVDHEEWYLVYGGSTSVGLFCIQLAKLAGFKVIATASPKNFDLVKQYGADEVVDYHNVSEAISSIESLTSHHLALGLDTISEGTSSEICLGAFSGSEEKKKKLNMLLPPSEDAKKKAGEVGVELEVSLAYTLLGKPFNFTPGMDVPAIPSDRAFYVKLNKDMESIFLPIIKPNPVKELDGGLDGILTGYQLMRDAKVSAEKLTYTIKA